MDGLTSTILCIILLFLSVVVIVVERRTRGISNKRHHFIHTIIPGSKLILDSKRHILFNIPDEVGNGDGSLHFQCNGELRQHSNVVCTLHGAFEDSVKVFEFNHNDRFVVDKDLLFNLGARNRVLSVKIDTYNPCSQNCMSDLIVTMTLNTLVG
jgi:hypothetical protein